MDFLIEIKIIIYFLQNKYARKIQKMSVPEPGMASMRKKCLHENIYQCRFGEKRVSLSIKVHTKNV